ncbi:hypothetical protein, partial [Nocardia brasiliensis]|uniref:hypothetical protein n=1 Tax=Nocardia brasiliensis TaxID=37326 RepID=UPI002455A4C0
MTTATDVPAIDLTAPDLHERAEALLRELAGPPARRRGDQWSAIEARVVERRRAHVVQRPGCCGF